MVKYLQDSRKLVVRNDVTAQIDIMADDHRLWVIQLYYIIIQELY